MAAIAAPIVPRPRNPTRSSLIATPAAATLGSHDDTRPPAGSAPSTSGGRGRHEIPLIASLAALLAAAFHVLFFILESDTFSQPQVAARFGLSTPEQVATVRPMAFNQGFYNLFLAIGVVGGLGLVASGSVVAGRAIVLFACASMVGAGIVLFASSRRFVRSAAIQALPPLAAIIAALVLT